MKWRCLNNQFGYCSDKPDCGKQMDVIKGKFLSSETASYAFFGGTCKLDPKACGKYQTLSEYYKGFEAPKKRKEEKADAGIH